MNNFEMGVRRGEIHWVDIKGGVGSEQKKSRPALIVSNNKNNEYSETIEVVYLTNQPKKDLPTHVKLKKTSLGETEGSTVLCEQINTISKKRLQQNSYIEEISDEDLWAVEDALMISLGLEYYMNGEDDKEEEQPKKVEPKVVEKVVEKVVYKGDPEKDAEIESLKRELYAETEERERVQGEVEELVKELHMARIETNFYKKKYDEVMERIMAKAKV